MSCLYRFRVALLLFRRLNCTHFDFPASKLFVESRFKPQQDEEGEGSCPSWCRDMISTVDGF